jgi:hypothetical protein
VNDHEKFEESAFPARSFIPDAPDLIVTLYEVPYARAGTGVNTTVVPLLVMFPGMRIPEVPTETAKDKPVTVEGSTLSLKMALIKALVATLKASDAGDIESQSILGGVESILRGVESVLACVMTQD